MLPLISDYTLIWDQRFVQPLEVHAPMDYTAPPPIRVPQVTQEHVNENFVNYIMVEPRTRTKC